MEIKKQRKSAEMMITAHMLSIPPYISTLWRNIASIHSTEDGVNLKLIVILNSGVQVVIPSLDQNQINSIFEAHARYGSGSPQSPASFSFPLSLQPDLLQMTTQHDPSRANSPEIPPQVLIRIASIAKILGLDDENSSLLQGEPNCNCPFCQVSRALSNGGAPKIEEEISDEDLQFRTWDIQQTAENLYAVSNPLDNAERYSVYLGDPIGCTCGQKNCEHIRAVLNS
jgi:hypothetical protein